MKNGPINSCETTPVNERDNVFECLLLLFSPIRANVVICGGKEAALHVFYEIQIK